MSAAFLAGVAAAYGIAVPVGAIAVLVVGLTARTSLRVGAAAGLGAATADGVYALVAVLGGAALAGLIAPVAVPLRWAAALVLLVLAGHGGTRHRTRRRREILDRRHRCGRYLAVLGLTLLNPATVVYFAALAVRILFAR